ncbi:MAG: hypothetical protein ACR2IF_10055 [Terriglobales bacterium]
MRRLVTILTLMMCSAAAVLAQSTLPGMLGGSSPAQPESDHIQKDVLLVNLGASTEYDDNAFNQVVAGPDQVLYSFTPRVAWNYSHRRWSTALDYELLESRSAKLDFYNRTYHNLGAQFDLQLSKRLSFTVRDNFNRSDNPLLQHSEFVPAGSIISQPNPSLFGAPQIRTTEHVSADMSYRLSARTTAGIGGGFTSSNYTSLSGASNTLQDTNTATGRAFYNHQFSAQQSAGLEYDISKFTSPGGFSTVSQRVLISHDYKLKRGITVTAFGGPNHVSSVLRLGGAGAALAFDNWSWSVGGGFNWSGKRTSFGTNVVHEVSDGGGLQGPVRLTSVNSNLVRHFGRRWTANVFGQLAFNNRLDPRAAGFENHKYASGGGSLNWKLPHNVSVEFSYSRQEQSSLLSASDIWIDRNRATVSVNYSFTHSLAK